ncbi:hypothetical protein P20439_1033 [Pseudoalteromonas sp. BSi20439]|nr:hypothetical protein P20439_1033 [Pseudoalteromonas sp. BSi20439]
MRTFCALLVFILVFYASCFPASAIEINSEFNSKKIESIHYSFTPTSLEDARQSNLQEWLLLNDKPLNLGLESRPVWIQFKIKNQLAQPLMPLLSLDNPLLNDVYFAHFMEDKLLTSTHIGDTHALSQRVIASESLLVKLTLPANSETTVYLNVNNDAGIGLRVPLTLWQQDSLLAYKSMVNLLYGLLIGFVFSFSSE